MLQKRGHLAIVTDKLYNLGIEFRKSLQKSLLPIFPARRSSTILTIFRPNAPFAIQYMQLVFGPTRLASQVDPLFHSLQRQYLAIARPDIAFAQAFQAIGNVLFGRAIDIHAPNASAGIFGRFAVKQDRSSCRQIAIRSNDQA
jgi:hypothetical protein